MTGKNPGAHGREAMTRIYHSSPTAIQPMQRASWQTASDRRGAIRTTWQDADGSQGERRMRYMQIIEARDVHDARRAYLQLLEQRGIGLVPNMTIFVETVHRSPDQNGAWLCYIAPAMQHAA